MDEMESSCTDAEKHVIRSWLDPMRPADDRAEEERKRWKMALFIFART